jgi:hypothetical protein
VSAGEAGLSARSIIVTVGIVSQTVTEGCFGPAAIGFQRTVRPLGGDMTGSYPGQSLTDLYVIRAIAFACAYLL